MIKDICKEFNKRNDQPNFKMKTVFYFDNTSDNSFWNTPVWPKFTENNSDEIDVENDMDKIVKQLDYRKITETKITNLDKNFL